MGTQAVIIGAGPGGLASAMILANSGMKVTVLERLDRVGGRTGALETQGFRFDLGPTFFLYPQILSEIFQSCGFRLDREVQMTRLDPQYHLRFEEGGDLRATPNVERMEREIARLAPGDASRFRQYLADNRRKFTAFAPILQQPFNSLADTLRLPFARLLPLLRPWASVDRDLGRYFRDPRVRLAFSFQSKYLGMSPFKCPSLFTILSFLEYEHGVWHPTGGCAAVTEAMARVARRMGVEIRLGEPVTGIDFHGRRATAVNTPLGRYPCDALVINADFAAAMQRLVPDHLRRRWNDRRLRRTKLSCSTFMMYLGIDGHIDDLEHHTIFLARDYKRNLREIEHGHTLSTNPSFYVQNACRTDPGLAPRGSSTLYVLAPVTHQHPNVDWSVEQPRFRALMFRQLRKLGPAFADLEKRIRVERILTPADWETELAIHRGATFNLAHSLDQMLHNRPRNRFEDLQGVYLVGGGTHPGSGLPVIFESARISSRLAIEDAGLNVPAPVPQQPSQPEPVLVGAA